VCTSDIVVNISYGGIERVKLIITDPIVLLLPRLTATNIDPWVTGSVAIKFWKLLEVILRYILVLMAWFQAQLPDIKSFHCWILPSVENSQYGQESNSFT
jgi:hypothetical protein